MVVEELLVVQELLVVHELMMILIGIKKNTQEVDGEGLRRGSPMGKILILRIMRTFFLDR